MAELAPETTCGILNLNKPPGCTSRDVVNRVARLFRRTRIGHAGTLDPLASGVLVVCLGPATRLVERIQQMPKTYRTVVLLGARSDTLDADGQIVAVENPAVPSDTEVREAIVSQVGLIEQIPPAFSALKVAGQRAYDLARGGQKLELAARPVLIKRVDLLRYEWPRVELEVECGAGTYIRSIARDIGDQLGCGGLVEVLTRTRIGPYRLEDAVDAENLCRDSLVKYLRPAAEALADLPAVRLNGAEVRAILQGQAIVRALNTAGREVALLDEAGLLVAIAEYEPGGGRIAPRRVFAKPQAGTGVSGEKNC